MFRVEGGERSVLTLGSYSRTCYLQKYILNRLSWRSGTACDCNGFEFDFYTFRNEMISFPHFGKKTKWDVGFQYFTRNIPKILHLEI